MAVAKDRARVPQMQARDRATVTDQAAKAIIAAEAKARSMQMEKLRALRLEAEASTPEPTPVLKKTATTTVRKRSAIVSQQ